MPAKTIPAGTVFTRLTVIGVGAPVQQGTGRKHLSSTSVCQCWCGKIVTVSNACLWSESTKSCGCLRSDVNVIKGSTHGKSGTPTHKSWKQMIQRCTNPNNPAFKDYGGRGIEVCERWRSFENFFDDMGEAPKGKTIGRVGNNGNYEKSNCRWETRKQQNTNSRHNIVFTVRGITAPLSVLCEQFSAPYSRTYQRIRGGMSAEEAFA